MRLLWAFALLIPASALRADDVTVAGPDGNVRFRLVRLDGDRLGYEVRFKGRPAVEPSRLGIAVDGVDLGQGAAVGAPEAYAVNDKYPVLGGHATAAVRGNGVRIPVKHARSGTAYTLDVRAFDDGVAFRFLVPGGDK